MSVTLSQIKADQLIARKAKDGNRVAYYSYLINEVQKIGKNDGNRETTDAETINVIRKQIAICNEKIQMNIPAEVEIVQQEKTILETYMPSQMSQDDLRSVITALYTSLGKPKTAMGALMKSLKENYEGKYDPKMASQLCKDIIQ